MSDAKNIDINQLKSDYHHKDQQITENFVEQHLPVIKSIAAKLLKAGKVPPCVEFDDLISWGIEGLIKAKKRYKKVNKSKFITYAYYRINGEILDQIRYAWKHRLPTDYNSKKERIRKQISEFIQDSIEESGQSVEEAQKRLMQSVPMVHYLSSNIENIISDKKGMKNPETEKIDESYAYIWESISELDSDDKTILDLFYVKNWKQNEIAEFLSMSKAKVCRKHKQILERLKIKLEKRKDEIVC